MSHIHHTGSSGLAGYTLDATATVPFSQSPDGTPISVVGTVTYTFRETDATGAVVEQVSGTEPLAVEGAEWPTSALMAFTAARFPAEGEAWTIWDRAGNGAFTVTDTTTGGTGDRAFTVTTSASGGYTHTDRHPAVENGSILPSDIWTVGVTGWTESTWTGNGGGATWGGAAGDKFRRTITSTVASGVLTVVDDSSGSGWSNSHASWADGSASFTVTDSTDGNSKSLVTTTYGADGGVAVIASEEASGNRATVVHSAGTGVDGSTFTSDVTSGANYSFISGGTVSAPAGDGNLPPPAVTVTGVSVADASQWFTTAYRVEGTTPGGADYTLDRTSGGTWSAHAAESGTAVGGAETLRHSNTTADESSNDNITYHEAGSLPDGTYSWDYTQTGESKSHRDGSSSTVAGVVVSGASSFTVDSNASATATRHENRAGPWADPALVGGDAGTWVDPEFHGDFDGLVPTGGSFASTLDETATATATYHADGASTTSEGVTTSGPWSVVREETDSHTRDATFTAAIDWQADGYYRHFRLASTLDKSEHAEGSSRRRVVWADSGYALEQSGASSSSSASDRSWDAGTTLPSYYGVSLDSAATGGSSKRAASSAGYAYSEAGAPGEYTFTGSSHAAGSSASSAWRSGLDVFTEEPGYESGNYRLQTEVTSSTSRTESESASASGSASGGAVSFDAFARMRSREVRGASREVWEQVQLYATGQWGAEQPEYSDHWERSESGGPGGGTWTETTSWTHPAFQTWQPPEGLWWWNEVPPAAPVAPGSGTVTTGGNLDQSGAPPRPAGVPELPTVWAAEPIPAESPPPPSSGLVGDRAAIILFASPIPDSVTKTLERAILSGDAAAVKSCLELMKQSGYAVSAETQAAANAVLSAAAAKVARERLLGELARIGKQAAKETGAKARRMLEEMAKKAGHKVVPGGEHLKVLDKAGNTVTMIPHTPKKAGTIRSIAEEIISAVK